MAMSTILLFTCKVHDSASADDAVKFIPLNEFMNGLGNGPDPPSYGYVAERCTALYSIYGKDLADETDPEKKRASEMALNKAENLLGAALKFNSMGTTQDFATIATNTTKYVVDLGKIYADRIYQARLRTGNAFDDPLIASDMSICRVVSDKLSAVGK
jgi:hypothetical protein